MLYNEHMDPSIMLISFSSCSTRTSPNDREHVGFPKICRYRYSAASECHEFVQRSTQNRLPNLRVQRAVRRGPTEGGGKKLCNIRRIRAPILTRTLLKPAWRENGPHQPATVRQRGKGPKGGNCDMPSPTYFGR